MTTNESIGTVSAKLGIDTLASAPVYSAVDIPEGGLLSTAWDELLLWFE